MKTNHNSVPQFRLRTNLIAGESLAACQRNLDYWRNTLEQKCSRGNRGYRPDLETEMKPWQVGSV